jgi:hypothetical protein
MISFHQSQIKIKWTLCLHGHIVYQHFKILFTGILTGPFCSVLLVLGSSSSAWRPPSWTWLASCTTGASPLVSSSRITCSQQC